VGEDKPLSLTIKTAEMFNIHIRNKWFKHTVSNILKPFVIKKLEIFPVIFLYEHVDK
jgi:hypothetical protein